MKKLYYLIIVSLFLLVPYISFAGNDLSKRLLGRILLQVENSGEAWYVSPADNNRYFLGRPNDAFSVMREQGIGISNNNLLKIPISLDHLSGLDSDGDGLPDNLEIAIGTDPFKKDSDGDGFDDYAEILNSYNPLGAGRLNYDSNFSKSQAGKIFLQVENNGEAWYVNPVNNRRYFLGRPTDAFNLMRNLGLGISNVDLARITEGKKHSQEVEMGSILDCKGPNDYQCSKKYLDLFTSRIQSCEPSEGTFSFEGEAFLGIFRGYKIIGKQNNLCSIDFWFLDSGEVPSNFLNKKMVCRYSDSGLKLEAVKNLEGCTGELVDEINASLGYQNSNVDVDKVNIGINLPKENFVVGESLEGGQYYFEEYSGDPFKALILMDDFSGIGRISHSTELLPFTSNIQTKVFSDAGTYPVSMHVYNCADVDKEMGTDDCGNGGWPPKINSNEIISRVNPIKSLTKNIYVVN